MERGEFYLFRTLGFVREGQTGPNPPFFPSLHSSGVFLSTNCVPGSGESGDNIYVTYSRPLINVYCFQILPSAKD